MRIVVGLLCLSALLLAEEEEERDVPKSAILHHFLQPRDVATQIPDLDTDNCNVSFRFVIGMGGDSYYSIWKVREVCGKHAPLWLEIEDKGPSPMTISLFWCYTEDGCERERVRRGVGKTAKVANGPAVLHVDASGNEWMRRPIREFGIWSRTSGVEGFCSIEHEEWVTRFPSTFDTCYHDSEISELTKFADKACTGDRFRDCVLEDQ